MKEFRCLVCGYHGPVEKDQYYFNETYACHNCGVVFRARNADKWRCEHSSRTSIYVGDKKIETKCNECGKVWEGRA